MADIKREVTDRVVKIVAEQLGLHLDEVSPKHSFVGDLKADSLDLTELIMNFEEEFKLEVSEEEAGNLVTVNDAIDYIVEHRQSSG